MTTEQASFVLELLAPAIEDEMKTTRRVMAAIPEDKRDYRPDAKSKTAFELAWHLASSDCWFLDGIASGEFAAGGDGIPENIKTVADIVAYYDNTAPVLLQKVRALPADRLATPVNFFNVLNQPAVAYLNLLIVHSVHHRGQLSVYLRPMGAKVPGIYGGSADEPFQAAAAE